MEESRVPVKNKQIQSLRGIAVLAVILFHLFGFPNSGFLGVTSFFVISGYVVTSILLKRKINQQNLRIFYRKRFLKLYPAMLVCILVTSIFSIAFLSPGGDAQSAFKVAFGGVFGISNFVLHFIQLDYFGPNIGFNPFSHFWSLSVEFQFYLLLAPMIWITSAKKKSSILLTSVTIGLVVSLFILFFQGNISDKLPFGNSLIGYYGLLSNSSPLLAGVLVAVLQFRGISYNVNRFIHNFAILILFGSYFVSNATDLNRFLGVACNILGTFLLLTSSIANSKISTNLLDFPLLQQIGDISYSLYLYHWPLICFGNILFPQSFWPKISLALIGFVLAKYSYNVLELQLKNRLQQKKLSFNFIALVITIPVLVLSLLYFASNGIVKEKYLANPVFKDSISNIDFQSAIDKESSACSTDLMRFTTGKIQNECRVKDSNSKLDIFVFGDSHAQQLYPGLANTFPKLNVGFFMKADGELNWQNKEDQKLWIYIVKDLKPRLIILNSRWDIRDITKYSDFLTRFKTINKHSRIKILLLSGNPTFPFEASVCKYGLPLLSNNRCSIDSKNLLRDFQERVQSLKLLSIRAELGFLDTFPVFCNKIRCSMISSDHILYRDNNHLSLFGTEDYITKISKYIS